VNIIKNPFNAHAHRIVLKQEGYCNGACNAGTGPIQAQSINKYPVAFFMIGAGTDTGNQEK
jgi:hypothetical protein